MAIRGLTAEHIAVNTASSVAWSGIMDRMLDRAGSRFRHGSDVIVHHTNHLSHHRQGYYMDSRFHRLIYMASLDFRIAWVA